ncbi:MAG: Hsp20/alpha crystallin family protein [Chlorobi bacterium]|nr:Hsp20/alpha crystallin family protein [Chlorobiota bacterium]
MTSGNIWDELNQVLETFFGNKDVEVYSVPAVNIKELPDRFVLEMAVPGFNKEDIKIEVDDGILVVRGEKKEEDKQEEKGRWMRREFHIVKFQRAFTLPDMVDADNITAKYENGILIINLPKIPEAQEKPARLIKVE